MRSSASQDPIPRRYKKHINYIIQANDDDDDARAYFTKISVYILFISFEQQQRLNPATE